MTINQLVTNIILISWRTDVLSGLYAFEQGIMINDQFTKVYPND